VKEKEGEQREKKKGGGRPPHSNSTTLWMEEVRKKKKGGKRRALCDLRRTGHKRKRGRHLKGRDEMGLLAPSLETGEGGGFHRFRLVLLLPAGRGGRRGREAESAPILAISIG